MRLRRILPALAAAGSFATADPSFVMADVAFATVERQSTATHEPGQGEGGVESPPRLANRQWDGQRPRRRREATSRSAAGARTGRSRLGEEERTDGAVQACAISPLVCRCHALTAGGCPAGTPPRPSTRGPQGLTWSPYGPARTPGVRSERQHNTSRHSRAGALQAASQTVRAMSVHSIRWRTLTTPFPPPTPVVAANWFDPPQRTADPRDEC